MKLTIRLLAVPCMAVLIGCMGLAADRAYAQGPQPQQSQGGRGGEEIRNMKIAFFTEALQLTPEQSAKFWPVYNQYWGELRKIGHNRRTLYKTIREGKPGESQQKELLSIMDAERKVTDTYIGKFKEVLPDDKVAKIFVADEDFKNYLIRRATQGGQGK